MNPSARDMGDVSAYNEVHRFFDLSPDLFAIIAPDGSFKRLNPAWETTLGYPTAELLATSAFELIHPDDLAATIGELEKLIDGRSSVSYENRCRHQDGSYRWLEWTSHYYDQDGLMYSVARDVTVRKQAEGELRRRRELNRVVIDNLPILLHVINRDGVITLSEGKALQLIGNQPGELEGRLASEIVQGQPGIAADMERAQAGERLHTIRSVGDLYLAHYYQPLFDQNGDPDGFIDVTLDVTEQIRFHETLQGEKKTLLEFINALPGMTAVTDLDGKLLTFNNHFAAYYVKTRAELAGQSIYDLLTPVNATRRKQSTQRVIETGQPLRSIAERDGRYYDVTLFPIFDAGGQVARLGSYLQDVTELKQAEVALRESEARFRNMADAAPVFIWTTDRNRQTDYMNQAWLTYTGRVLEQEIGTGWAESIHPDDVERVLSTFTDACDRLQPFDVEYRLRRADGAFRWILDTGAPRFTSDSEFLGYVGSGVDIHDRKLAETALRQSEQTLRELLNGSLDMAFLCATDGRLIAFNTRFAGQFDPTMPDLRGVNIYDLLPPDLVVFARVLTDEVIAVKQPFHQEIEFGGQAFDYSVHPILDEQQEVVSLAIFWRDITQRKLTEQKLANSEQLFRNVLESAAQGILLTDETGVILLVNRQIELQFGYTRDELFGQSVDMLLPESQRDLHIRERANYVAQPHVRHMGVGLDVFARRKDGGQFPAEIGLSYLQRDDKTLLMAFITDITERRQMEQERLDHQREQLEMKQERELMDLRQRFMSMVSHEFRTPLTVIASSAEMLEHYYDRLPRERQMEKLQVINGQVRSMVGLLDDILALNKMQAGADDFAPEPLDLPLLCGRILDTIKVIDREQHQFMFDSIGVPATIQADRRLLEHIVTNLLSNAIKYSPAGSAVHFSLRGTPDSVTLEIRDEGMGIPPEDQPKLFEPFFRARNARHIDGTGLGLPIVKHNVEKHGGTITVRSAEGVGSVFVVELPLSG